MASTLSFDREFAEQYGITAALLYQELRRKYYFWKKEKRLVDDFFWCEQETLADWLLISSRTIRNIIKTLEDAGLIEHKVSYRPGTRTPATWWRVIEKKKDVNSEAERDSVPEAERDSSSILNQNTEATTATETADGSSETSSATILPLAQLQPLVSRLVKEYNAGSKDKIFFEKKKMKEYYPQLREKLEDAGIDFGRKEVEQVFRNALERIKDPDFYLSSTRSADIFYHPHNIQHFLVTGDVKVYDEVTTRGYQWIIEHGYAKDFADIESRAAEIMEQVGHLEEYQKALRGM